MYILCDSCTNSSGHPGSAVRDLQKDFMSDTDFNVKHAEDNPTEDISLAVFNTPRLVSA
jgi:hypothetical protein